MPNANANSSKRLHMIARYVYSLHIDIANSILILARTRTRSRST